MQPTLLSIAVENHPGALADLLDALAKAKVNVHAVEAEARGDFGDVRLLTDEPDRAAGLLRTKGYDVLEAEVLVLDLPNKPGELARVTRALADANVNVVSVFGTTPSATGTGRILLRVNNAATARKALKVK